MQIPLQNLHAKIMATIVSESAIPPASSSFCVYVHLMFFFLPFFCLFSFQAPVPREGGVKAEVLSLPVFIFAPSNSALSWLTFY